MEQKRLRSGYTTGTCAAAAAGAAAELLLTGSCPDAVQVELPGGKLVGMPWEEVAGGLPKMAVSARTVRVQKDAGDDPDVTHGAWIYGTVTVISRAKLEELKNSGAGYFLPEYPDLYLSGGEGIGMVTKQGLSCPVNHYAINPVPRKMILLAVEKAVRKAAFAGCLFVQIAIPDGAGLAEKTFNPRLGIMGGISVLGTTGIVKPMSEAALVATIRLDIHMKSVEGQQVLLMAPGNYGEAFLQEQMGVNLGEAVLCSNFVRDAAQMMAEEGVRQVLFVSHIGKLVKVSAGIENTHSRYGDGRMEQVERLAVEAWRQEQAAGLWQPVESELRQSELCKLQQTILRCNTTDEAIGLLQENNLAELVLALAAEKAKAWMEAWAGKKVQIEVVTFSSAQGLLGKTGGADALFETWKEQI